VGTQLPYQIHCITIPQKGKTWTKPFDLLRYLWTGYSHLKSLQKKIKAEIIHVHAPDKCGILGAWLASKYNVPLVLTEHWAIYTQSVSDYIGNRNAWFKFSMKTTWNRTDLCMPVSDDLQQQMQRYFQSKKHYCVIPNVVPNWFFQTPIPNLGATKWIHVSNGEPRKNVDIIVAAFERLKSEYPDAELTLIGFDPIQAAGMDLTGINGIRVLGKLTSQEVAVALSKSSTLLLVSDAENSPCVIGEALSVGLPVFYNLRWRHC